MDSVWEYPCQYSRGENIQEKTEAFIGENWYTISEVNRQFDKYGKPTVETDLMGRSTMSQWNCCHRVAETRPDGSMTTWVYDDENRLTEMSRLTSLDSTNVTWITTKYAYDGLGREIMSQVTNLVAGVGLPSTQRTYDGLGRLATETNEAGRVTTWVYSAGGLTTTTTYPNGAMRVQSRAADGLSSSVTGTASVPEWTTITAQSSGGNRGA